MLKMSIMMLNCYQVLEEAVAEPILRYSQQGMVCADISLVDNSVYGLNQQ